MVVYKSLFNLYTSMYMRTRARYICFSPMPLMTKEVLAQLIGLRISFEFSPLHYCLFLCVLLPSFASQPITLVRLTPAAFKLNGRQCSDFYWLGKFETLHALPRRPATYPYRVLWGGEPNHWPSNVVFIAIGGQQPLPKKRKDAKQKIWLMVAC